MTRPDEPDPANSPQPYQAPGDPGPEDSGGPKPVRQAAIAFILLTLFIDILGIGIIIPVLPEVVEAFVGGDTSRAGIYVGVIAASYSLMQFIFAPIIGALSDRFGRRPVLLGSMFGLGIDFLIQGFAPTIAWLFAGRVLAGIMGASITTANAYIADVSDDENRARNYGLVGAMFGLGFTVGPALGGLLGSYWLRLPFFVSAGLALVNWLYGYFILPESLPPERRSALNLAKANPVGSLGLLKRYPIVAGMAIAYVCASLAQRGLENVWVLQTGFRYGWGTRTNGLVLGLVGVMAMIVMGGMVRPTVRRFGERRVAIAATIISAVAFLGYGLASEGWMVPIIIVFGSLGGLASPAVQSIVASAVPSGDQGKVQGALTSLVSLTNIAAPLIFTAGLFSYFTSEHAPIILPGAPFFLGSALLFGAAIVLNRVFVKFPSAPPAEEDGQDRGVRLSDASSVTPPTSDDGSTVVGQGGH
ncbi:TCR/Tet family MFS transporter [Crateriforma conspicua]|uniref:TCR/Tet family MFS transporter n=1 Tax=Crateriforma conspicua TaxID=2527996 RepID=UPI00118C3B04|nr:TCR/Tet family MFS transporter [Crateriforma conspicua]QDV64254.1 Tetracycline resistance protein, class C [Crateriforma conspicua]